MTINPMHTTITYDINNNIYLTNIEQEKVTDLISFSIAPWADKIILGEILRKLGQSRNWC